MNTTAPCTTGKTYFISCSSYGEQLIFSSSALCVHMLELMRSYRSSRVVHRKRVREVPRVSILSYSILPEQYVCVLRQEIEGGIEFFCTQLNMAIERYYQAMFKTALPSFSKHLVMTEILSQHELRTAIRYVNLSPWQYEGVHDGLEGGEYPWSSYAELMQPQENPITDVGAVSRIFGSRKKCRHFIQTGRG